MGSLSLFIKDASVESQLDDIFNTANEKQDWDYFLDDSYFIFLKAIDEKPKISFSGALTLVQFYYNNVLATSNDDEIVEKTSKMLTRMLTICADRHVEECPDWYNKLATIIPTCFIPCLKLTSPYSVPVKEFALKQVLDVVQHSPPVSGVQWPQLLESVAALLPRVNSSVITQAKALLVQVCRSDDGLTALFADTAGQDALKAAINVNSTGKYNVFEVAQRVCVMGRDQLSLVSNSGLLDQLVAEASSEDTLSQLVALEIISDLVSDEHCLDHLCSAGVMHKMYDQLQRCQPNAADSINIPGILKVFGSLGRLRPNRLCTEHRGVMSIMLDHCTPTGHNTDACLALLSLETVTIVASTMPGRRELQHHFKNELEVCLREVGEQLRKAPVDRRPRFLAALVMLLDVTDMPTRHQDDRAESDDVSDLLECWYRTVFPCGTVDPVAQFLRMPFENAHLEAYNLLAAIARHAWGVTLIASNDRTMTYLLDRSTECSKDGKEHKTTLLGLMLSHSDIICDVAGQQTLDKTKAFYAQGPYYVTPHSDDGGPAQMVR